jgi:hypothetical protein
MIKSGMLTFLLAYKLLQTGNNYINNKTAEPCLRFVRERSFLHLKTRKIINGGCVKIKQKITLKNIIVTPNLNLMIYFFNPLYIYVFTFILWNMKERMWKVN